MEPQEQTDTTVFEPLTKALTQAFVQNLNETLQNLPSALPAAFSALGLGAREKKGEKGAGLPPITWEMPKIEFDAERMKALCDDYVKECRQLWQSGVNAAVLGRDKRFAAPAWSENQWSTFAVAVYQLNARTLEGMVEAAHADSKTRARLHFFADQWKAAAAPSNFLAFNAEAQRRVVETRGASIAQGVRNLFQDVRRGHLSMTDESLFEVGRNVATTEGAVVFENALFQLIEYKPLTATVFDRPFLIVPPCINKFYILDLQPSDSFIRYAVEQGQHVFVISWRNPEEADEELRQATWDDYIENAAIRAIHAVQEITGSEQINVLGFCVGGTILTTALAVLAARGEQPAASLTLLTTLLDFAHTGVLDLFVDEPSVRLRELQMGRGGLMAGIDLSTTFSFLRPDDLVWNYVVANYLKGETPPAFDLLYWNCDSTNLPGPFYAWYLRYTYLENKLRQPSELTVCGEKINLGAIKAPVYIYGSREDHIVPIDSAYASTRILRGKKRFVMGASGHIAGVINPPAKHKRSYWLREDGKIPKSHAEWAAGATEHPGSWWPDWSAWLGTHGGKQIPAPRRYGRGTRYRSIEPAPGRYVKTRI
ncbi:MAG: class I poly(R)-hydroxyalkanoic acid synthase [Burkholderiaceae bacterium]|jgi:polyhydroxyalkanoate synthase|nr:class I poly(R)-hydroxyalkanoic acid synthase [Burkholderiaceae bacterium]